MAGEWSRCSLADLIDVKHGFAFEGEFIYDEARGDVLLTPGNFAIGGGFKGDKFKYYDGPVPDDFVLNVGDLLVTMTDLSKQSDTLGFPAFVPSRSDGRRYLHNQRLGRVLVKDPRVLDTKYLHYLLCSADYRHEVLASATGTTVKHTSPDRIRRFTFLRPPLPEQRTIAYILGTLDAKIELNRQMNETLEAMARALFKSWFVDFAPVRAKVEGRWHRGESLPGFPAHLFDLFPDSFEDSELGEIPKGWEVTSLLDLFFNDAECVLTGPFGSTLHAHDYSEEGVPLILVKHVINGRISTGDMPLVGNHKLPELARYRLQLGDIVFTRVGAVGRSAYTNAGCVGWLISGQLLRVRVPDWSTLHPRYLSQLYQERAFIDMVEGFALGTTRPSLNTQLLREFRFIHPPGYLVQRYSEEVTELDARGQKSIHSSTSLAALRDTLLPKLISGKIRVADAEKFTERMS
jgi:type I restriction enzyme, S subunit